MLNAKGGFILTRSHVTKKKIRVTRIKNTLRTQENHTFRTKSKQNKAGKFSKRSTIEKQKRERNRKVLFFFWQVH